MVRSVSFYVLVFNTSSASDEEFMGWWDVQSRWALGHDYNDPEVLEPQARALFEDLLLSFPAMNGPRAYQATPELLFRRDLDELVTDYSLAPDFVYAAFSWSQADAAAHLVSDLAARHGMAVAWVSADPLVIDRPALS